MVEKSLIKVAENLVELWDEIYSPDHKDTGYEPKRLETAVEQLRGAIRMEKENGQVKLVSDWNRKYEPGIDVIVTLDDGTEKRTKTRSKAYMLGGCRDYLGHTAVIGLEGISGCYMLERVRPA